MLKVLSRFHSTKSKAFGTFLHQLSRGIKSRFWPMAASPSTAIVQRHEDEDAFTFSFYLNLTEFNTERQFNMRRPLTEKRQQFLQRLSQNVSKAVAKKKSNKAKNLPEFSADFFSDGELLTENDEEMETVIRKNGLEIEIHGKRFDVALNPPVVVNLTLPTTIMAGFNVYPSKLALNFASKSHSRYSWFVSKAKYEGETNPNPLTMVWRQRAEGFYFQPSTDDVGCYVKLECTPANEAGDTGCTDCVISKSGISAGPGACPFEVRHMFTKEFAPEDQVRSMTYNLLADLYADSDYSRQILHPQCPPYALAFPYRKQLLIKEIQGYNADLICLQEVDRKLFEHDLQPILGDQLYEGTFAKKGGEVSEGLACFWRTNKLEVVESEKVILSEAIKERDYAHKIRSKLLENSKLEESLLQRTTALQITVLKMKSMPNRGLLVGTTHLYFKPDADHIRLLQVGVCMEELKLALAKVQKAHPDCKFSLILSGDFNSTPPFGVLEFMRRRVIAEDHADWSSCPGEEVKEFRLEHPFHMDSACGTPKYTNFTTGFADCLDYIFYDCESLRVTEVVPFPTEEELKLYTAIPNVVYPSDHIACVANLKFI